MAVRSDNGGESFAGDSGKLCPKRGIKQEFTPADRPKYNGVAERALALINDTDLAARIQTSVLYPGAPAYTSLWGEAVSCACHVLNRTAITANSGDSPHTRCGTVRPSPPRGGVAICRVQRENKSQPKAQDCYYVGPSVDHPCDCMRVLIAHRSILTTPNVTWQHIPWVLPRPGNNCPILPKNGSL